jgi:hypothetical protein
VRFYLKVIPVFLSLVLLISAVLPGFADASASTNVIDNSKYIQDESSYLNEESELAEEELPEEIIELEVEIDNYLSEFNYSEQDFENMSEEEFEQAYEDIYNSSEFLTLEEEYNKEYSEYEKEQEAGMMKPMIVPILVPIAAAAGRFAIQAAAKHGTKVASKYLKNKLKKVGKNYKLYWNEKNRNGKITSLLKIQHKPSKQMIFRVDNGTIPLKPGSSSWYWHYHIASGKNGMSQHYSLRSLVPSKHKPKSNTTLY